MQDSMQYFYSVILVLLFKYFYTNDGIQLQVCEAFGFHIWCGLHGNLL